MKRIVRCTLGVTAVIFSCTSVVHAQPTGYPAKPVRVVLSAPAGGALDSMVRAIGESVGQRLGQPWIVENRPGAGGNIGAAAVAKESPDGYTLLFAIETTFTVNPSLYNILSFDPARDFTPIQVVAKFGNVLVVHPSVPAGSLGEFIALAKSRTLSYASAGNGSPAHLSFAFLESVAGIKATQIPYKGAPPMILDLLAGRVQAAMIVSSPVIPHIRDGKLRALAFSSKDRSQLLPEIPTVAESGYPGFDVSFAYLLMAPAGVTESIVNLLNDEVRRAVTSDVLRKSLHLQDLDVVAGSPRDAALYVKAQREKWSAEIKRAGIRID